MIKTSFYIENLKINLKILGYISQKLPYLFPSKAPREFSPLILFLLDMLLRIHKNFFDVHQQMSAISPNGRVDLLVSHYHMSVLWWNIHVRWIAFDIQSPDPLHESHFHLPNIKLLHKFAHFILWYKDIWNWHSPFTP